MRPPAPVLPSYGLLDVLERVRVPAAREAVYRCLCRCGKTPPFLVRSSCLRRGDTQSCGCLRAERVKATKRRQALRRRAAMWFRGKGEKRS